MVISSNIVFRIVYCSVIVLAGFVHFSTYLSSDLGWHLHIADAMLHGKKLYVDLFEVNTPLILYITLLPTSVAMLLGVNAILCLQIFNFALAVLSFALCIHILKQSEYRAKPLVMLIFIAWAIFFVPFAFPYTEFGQKEHVFMLLFMPYLLLFALQVNSLKPALYALSLALAMIGLLIKPFFILLYLSICIVRIFEDKRNALIEFKWVFVTQCTLYTLLYLIHTPYFTEITPIALQGYKNLNTTDGTLESLWRIFSIVTLNTVLFYLLPLFFGLPVINRGMARLLPLLLAALGIVLIQAKCFWYHYIPFFMVMSIFFGIAMQHYIQTIHQKEFLKVVNMVLIVGCIVTYIPYIADNYRRQNGIIEHMISQLQQYRGERVLIISPHIYPAFPIVNYLDFKWDLKEHSMQILDGSFKHPELTSKNQRAIKHVVDDVIQALRKSPKLVLVRTPPRYVGSKSAWLFFFQAKGDYIEFFSANKEFSKLWKYYKLRGAIEDDHEQYLVYERR